MTEESPRKASGEKEPVDDTEEEAVSEEAAEAVSDTEEATEPSPDDSAEQGDSDDGDQEPAAEDDGDAAEDTDEPSPDESLEKEETSGSWYVIHSFSGHEQKVKRLIESQIAEKYPDRVLKVLIPTEQITRTRAGKRSVREKKLYPGYVFALLDITEEMVMDIRAMSNVSGFPPMNKGFPQPLRKDEVERIIGQAEGREAPKSVRVPFGVGQTVRVVSGPFNNFSGVVESINPERGRVRVIFTIFGRKAPVELDFSQVRIN